MRGSNSPPACPATSSARSKDSEGPTYRFRHIADETSAALRASEPASCASRYGSLPTVRAINQASIPHPQTPQPGSTSMPQTLQAAQVDTGALPTVTALSRAQHGRRLLEARRKPVELVNAPTQADTGTLPTVTALSQAQHGRRLLEAPRKPVELVNDSIYGPSFDGTAEPPPTKLGMAIDSKSRANSDSIPPKTIRQVFTLGCSLLLPTITAGKLSNGKGMEIGRMQAIT